MEKQRARTVLLMADDDEDDCLLMAGAIREAFQTDNFHCLKDGQELLDYLFHRGFYEDNDLFPSPDLIFLDLNMPKKDGRQTLKEIKTDPQLRMIPVIIYTTSSSQQEIELCYKLGANSYIVKPISFERLVETVRCLNKYWFEVATLPLSKQLRACNVPLSQKARPCERVSEQEM